MFPLNTFENLCVFFLLLMIYSAAGWVGEMFYCSVGKGHICEKRGFLNGFICPIYGHGALLVLYVLHGGLKNPLLTFLAGMALTSALEYFTSWFMEAVFHMRWWDYSRKKIQLNGRICLQNSLRHRSNMAFLHVTRQAVNDNHQRKPLSSWLHHLFDRPITRNRQLRVDPEPILVNVEFFFVHDHPPVHTSPITNTIPNSTGRIQVR